MLRVPAIPRTMTDLREWLVDDWITHGRSWTRPEFHAVATHRLGTWARNLSGPARPFATAVYLALYTIVRNLYGIELPLGTRLGRRVLIAHVSGIVIASGVEIGDDCIIRQGVTIGGVRRGRTGGRQTPVLEDGVEVGAGAVIVGGVTVGTGATIGPNAVVMKDVPKGGTAFAAPARIIGPLNRQTTNS